MAPPIAPAGTPAPAAAPRTAATPSSSIPLAALTGAAGRHLWTRDGLPGDRAVAAGDAVIALEAPPAASPTAAPLPAPAGSPTVPSAPSATASAGGPYRLVVLDGASGKVRATHNLGGGAGSTGSAGAAGSAGSGATPGPLTAQAYRRAPGAAVSLPGPSGSAGTIEVAYDPTGRRVWRSPWAGIQLFGDEGEYATADSYTKPPVGGPLTPIRQLKTLSGKDIVSFGPTGGEQVTMIHGDAAVLTRGQGFRVATVARHPRTRWSSSQVAPHGFARATPISVLGARLLVEWDGAASHLLALYDLDNGRQAWRSESLTGQVTPGAVVEDADSHVAVIGSDGRGPTLGIDGRTGKIQWRIAGSQNVRPIAGGHGRVYGASGDTALAIDARTGRITTLGTHVEVVGLTSDGVLVLRGAVSPAGGRIWAFRPNAGP